MLNIAKLLRYQSESEEQQFFMESLLINFMSIAVCFFFIYTLNNYFLGHLEGVYIMDFGGILELILLLLFIRKKLSFFTTVNAGIFVSWVCLILDVVFTGGIFSPSLPWVMLIPMISFLLQEKSTAHRIWFVVAIATFVFFGACSLLSISFPNRILESELTASLITSYIGLASMLIIITFIFEKKKNRIFEKLEHKQDQLASSEKRFRTMFEKAPLGIGLTNSITGEIEQYNSKYAEIVGRSVEDMEHIDWMSITHPEDIAVDQENMERMNKGEIPGYKLVKRYIRPDGTIRWVELSITPINSADKEIPQHLCMVEDITEQINEEQKRKAEEQNTLLLQHASQIPGVIYQFHYVDKDEFSFPFQSEGVYDLFETSAADLMENPILFLDKIHPDDLPGLIFSITQSMKTLNNWVYDFRVILNEKGTKWLRGNSKPERLADGSILSHGYISDITSRKKFEELEVERNKELLTQQKVLLELTRLPSDLEFDAKLKTILKKTAETIHCERVGIWVLKGEMISADFVYHLSKDDYFPGSTLYEKDFPYYINEIKKNKNVVANDTFQHASLIEFKEYFELNGIHSMLDIPISKGTEVIGVICHEHVGPKRKWSDSEQAFTRSISDIVSLAFESEELKKAKETLRFNEERWKFAIEASNDGMWDWNLETSQVYRSPKWAEMLGYSPAEIEHHLEEWSKRIHPEDMTSVTNLLQLHLKGETPSYISEHRVLCKDDSYKWILDRGKVIEWSESGKPLRVIGTQTDITKRKRAENDLKQSKEKLQAIFTGSNDAIMLLTAKGFFDCNPKTLEMFAIETKEQFTNCHPSDISPETQPDGRNSFEKANEMMEIAFRDGVNRFEWLHKRKDGEPFQAEVLLSAFKYGEERVLQATVLDITDRKIAAQQLQLQKEFYENVLNHVPIEIVVFDSEHRYLFVNPSAIHSEEMRNYIIGKDDFEYCAHTQKNVQLAVDLRARFTEVKTLGKVHEWEDTVKHSDGTTTTFLRGMTPVFDSQGEMKQVIGYGFDISDRKQVEYYLEMSEERLRLVLAGTNDGWWDWDLIHDKLYYSPRWWTMFGYTENEIDLNPTSYKSIVHPEDLPFVEQKFQESLENQTTSYEIECRLLNKKGEYIPILSRGYILRDDNNLPIRVSGSDMDLSERKRANEKIKQSEEKYRSLIENSPEIIMITNKNEVIEFLNIATNDMSIEEIVGNSLYDFIEEEQHERVRKAHEKIFNGAKAESYETEKIKADGSKTWYLTHVGPRYKDEKVTGLVLFIRNITDLKKSEEHIKQSLNEKEVLLKEVHHRVKNNLQIISSILNLQSSTITDKQTLDMLKNSQDRIRSMSLIHELLYQTKDFSTINFSEYIRSIATNLFRSYTQNKMIELVLDIDTIFLDLDHAIPCGLIINELITNSLKYGFDSQREGEIKIKLVQKDDLICLNISDNGKGFPAHINFRETESLGMQLVVSLVEQIDGSIELINENGAHYSIVFKK